MNRRTLSIVLMASGLLLTVGYATDKIGHQFALVAGLLLFGAGGLLFPLIYRVAEQLRPWLGTQVQAKVWGGGLPGHEGTMLRFERTMAIGAGLHFYFQAGNSGKHFHLKVAQPGAVLRTDQVAEIGTAKYVQWCGKKIKRVPGEKALVLQFAPTETSKRSS